MNPTLSFNTAAPNRSGRTVFSTALLLALLGLAGTVPAMADNRPGYPQRGYDDPRDRYDRGRWNRQMSWQEHEREARRWRMAHRAPYPGVVYAPPPVIYGPPQPSPGLTLVFPLDLR